MSRPSCFWKQYKSYSDYYGRSFYIQRCSVLLGICLSPKWVLVPITITPSAKTLLQGGSFWNGHFKRISAEPTGVPQRDWINSIPNDGLIYYTSLLNQGRLLITSPQALSEVLTTKSYDFIKPQQLRNGLGRVLGIGILLAEGDEHKVRSIAVAKLTALMY